MGRTTLASAMPEAQVGTISTSAPGDSIRQQRLQERHRRLLKSPQFARSARLCSLLLHLLEAREDPRSGPVTERTIGIAIFGREPDWDPSIDPCVRVAMGRLRHRLAEYFKADGIDDPAQIVIAKGSYLAQVITVPEPVREMPEPLAPCSPQAALPVPERKRWFILAVCLSVLAVCLLLWMRRSATQTGPPAISIVPFATEMGKQFSPAISPDGRRIAYVWDQDKDQYKIYVRAVEGHSAVRLSTVAGDEFYPAWSPQGSSVAFLRNTGWEGKLIVHAMSDGSEKTVATIDTAPGRWSEDTGPLLGDPGPEWSADGTELIAFDQGHFGIYAISITTGDRHQLTTDTQTTRDFYPRLSPDSKVLAYAHYVSHGVSDLYLLPMQPGSQPRRVTHDGRTIRGLSWARDSRSLVFASNRNGPFELWRVDASTDSISALAADTSQAADPAVAPDGNWLAFDNFRVTTNIEQAPLHMGASDTIAVAPLIASQDRNRDASLSPDGKRLLFITDRSGSWQIWRANSDGTQVRQLTFSLDSYPGSISWSPDSRHIIYDGRLTSHSSLLLMDTDTGVITALSHGTAEERLPSWAADGKTIYFSSDRDGAVALYRMDPTSGVTVLVAPNGFRGKATSDGRWLYFCTMYGELWRVPQPGGEPMRLPDFMQPTTALTWTVVGNRLLLLRNSPSMHPELWEVAESLSFLRLGTLLTEPHRQVFSISTSADGHQLFVETRLASTSEIVLRKSAPVHWGPR